MSNQNHTDTKIVTEIPVHELRAGSRLISTIRLRNLAADEVKTLLQTQIVRFAVADLGRELYWVANNERFEFWKGEVKAHLTTWDRQNDLADFPDAYFFIASEWQSYNSGIIILLEKYH